MKSVKSQQFLFRKILSQFNRDLKLHHLFPKKSRILLAVSGGADSMAMLNLFAMIQKKLDLIIAVAHVNHGLRQESVREATFVREAAFNMDFPYYEEAQKGLLSAKGGDSVEDAARNFRYQFLSTICKSHNYQFLSTGHNCDDQAETILMRLISGTGLPGLAGIQYLSQQYKVNLVRPLLNIRRDVIRKALRQAKIRYTKDASNDRDVYLRNRIRNKLIPQISRQYNPCFTNHLVAIGQEAALSDTVINGLVMKLFKKHCIVSGDSIMLSAPKLKQEPYLLRTQLYRMIYKELTGAYNGLTRRGIESVDTLLQAEGGKTVKIHNRLQVVNRSNKLIFLRNH